MCRNPLLAAERKRKREDLIQATEKELEKVAVAARRAKNSLRGKALIGLRVGRVLGRFKMGKHFKLEIAEENFSYQRNQDSISAGSSTRRDLRHPHQRRPRNTEPRRHRALLQAPGPRGTRLPRLKTVDLKLRPIHHHLADRVRAHVFICMLAYYVEWHMRRASPPCSSKTTTSPQPHVGAAPPSPRPCAPRRPNERRTPNSPPTGLRSTASTLLEDLATIAKNSLRPRTAPLSH